MPWNGCVTCRGMTSSHQEYSTANLFGHYMAAVYRVKCLSNEGEKPEPVFACQGGELDVLRQGIYATIKEMASHAD